jgi:hypothetical protein
MAPAHAGFFFAGLAPFPPWSADAQLVSLFHGRTAFRAEQRAAIAAAQRPGDLAVALRAIKIGLLFGWLVRHVRPLKITEQ